MWSRAARFIVLGTILLGSRAAGAQDPDAAFKGALEALPRSVFHSVAEGETLATIAAYYLGDPKQAPKILAANRDRLKDPRRLVPGMTIEVLVPSDWQPREPLDQWRARNLKPERHGSRLFLYTDRGEEGFQAIAPYPAGEKVLRRATLEDLFLKLTGRELRA